MQYIKQKLKRYTTSLSFVNFLLLLSQELPGFPIKILFNTNTQHWNYFKGYGIITCSRDFYFQFVLALIYPRNPWKTETVDFIHTTKGSLPNRNSEFYRFSETKSAFSFFKLTSDFTHVKQKSPLYHFWLAIFDGLTMSKPV